jgi:UDP-3-O-[3-hydroxymyristoyl] glucosamine N-acyltransferase
MNFQELAKQLDLKLEQTSLHQNPGLNPIIRGVAAVNQALAGTLAFIESASLSAWVEKTQASALILPKQSALEQTAEDRGIAWIATDQPRLLFAQALALFYQPWQPEAAIHPTATIHPSVQLGHNISVGANVTIQADAVLGEEVCLHPGVVIYPGVHIGDRTVLHANCTIHERAVIGQDCVIHSGTVIGAEGFGFVPTATGWYKMHQSGRTVLEDEVEVGCNSTIDRPAVGETRVGRGTKVDNLVQIGHGCQIGQHCILVSQVGLAGAVELGDRVVLAGQCGIADKVKIGTGAIVTGKSGVFQDVAPGETVSGFPAVPSKLWLRTSLLVRRLPELFRQISTMSRKLDD